MMTTGVGFSLYSGFTQILCRPEKPLARSTPSIACSTPNYHGEHFVEGLALEDQLIS